MTLIFGKLTGSFSEFARVIGKLALTPDDLALQAQLRQGQIDLKHVAALDSLYLTLIGIGMFFVTYAFVSAVSSEESLEKKEAEVGRTRRS